MKKKLMALFMSAMCVMSLVACSSGSKSTGSDYQDIQNKGTLVVGITDFAPMDYQDENGEWIGFDADMAKAFGESIGVDVEFVEIDWDNKVMELDGKTVDCIWNGMTLTEEVTSAMSCSKAYCNNAQIIVLKQETATAADSLEGLFKLNFAVEAGSAGEAVAQENELSYTPVESQANALMEVAAGTSDAAIIDSLMAAAMVGEGTSYEDLIYMMPLSDEEYGVGFRKDSDMAPILDAFFATAKEDGTMQTIAEKYGVQAALIED